MRRSACGLIWLCFLFLSCTNRSRVPSGIIEPDSMRVLFHDVIVADQFVSQFLLKDSLTRDVKKESQELYERMFAMHHTTREAFRQSLTWYATRPDLEKMIFDSLSSSVTQERSLMYKEKYGKRDSLAKKTADSLALIRRGPPPLNPDSLKRVILQAHPGIPVPVLLDSVHRRMRIRATEDSLRLVEHIRDSTTRHRADSVMMKKHMDSLRKAGVPGRPLPGRPGLNHPLPSRKPGTGTIEPR